MKVSACRMCQSENLVQWLDLGLHPHSDQFHKSIEPEMRYPLGVSQCQDCGLNQLTYIVAKEELYLKDYLYESSITKTADAHWTEFAETVSKKSGFFGTNSQRAIEGRKEIGLDKKNQPKHQVLDIGSNDGTLLTKFQSLGFTVMGFDPTPEATQIAIDRGVPTIQDFFTKENGKKYLKETADIIVGTNVFAHVHDLDDFIEGVKETLAFGGIFVFESPYFGEFLKGLEYDTVYHQHLSYLSLNPVIKFMEKHGMEVFDVEQRPLHGGAFRVYIARKGQREVSTEVHAMKLSENWRLRELEEFARMTRENCEDLCFLLQDIYRQGKTVAVVSTPAKGNTLMNYTGIGRYISFATDKSKLKQGRYTPGTFIKVYSDEELVKRQPDYALILAWNFFDEIKENVKKAGYKGKFIRPLPNVEIYE